MDYKRAPRSRRLWVGLALALSLAVAAAVAVPVASAHTAQAPTNLTVTLDSSDNPVLSWTAPENAPTQYQIYRMTPGQLFKTHAAIGAGSDGSNTTFTDYDYFGRHYGYNYYYVASVHLVGNSLVDGRHESGPSNIVSILIPDPAGTGGL